MSKDQVSNSDFDDFIKDVDEYLKRENTPLKLLEASGNWIPLRDAIRLTCDLAHVSTDEARRAVCQRAMYSVGVRVNSFSRGTERHDWMSLDDFLHNRGESQLTHFSTSPLPADFREAVEFFTVIGKKSDEAWPDVVKFSDWAMGDFDVRIEEDFCVVNIKVCGIQFDRDALIRSIGLEPKMVISGNAILATSSDVTRAGEITTQAHKTNIGGRPATDHGQPISSLTVKLMASDPAYLANCTAASLARDLAEEYRECGMRPPHDSNLEKFAMGILRVIRKQD